MKFSELPQEIQDKLISERNKINNTKINTPYRILLYNKAGTRYFEAYRVQNAYSDNKGNYMPFGGGSKWIIKYGKVGFRSSRDPLGGLSYSLCNGQTFTGVRGISIPSQVSKKSEVIDIIKKIGIFDL